MIRWIRIRINLQMSSQNVPMEYEPIFVLFFKVWSLYLEAQTLVIFMQKSISAGPSLQIEWRDRVRRASALSGLFRACFLCRYSLLTVRFPI
jgi:hypothetical protein